MFKMNEPVIALIAVGCNVGAQLAMKYAGQEKSFSSVWNSLFSPWLIFAVLLYGVSFLLTVRVFAANSLSVASPVMAGSTFLLIAVASWLVFGENISYQKIAGIGLIAAGIVVLTRA